MPTARAIARCPLRPTMREIRAAAAAILNEDKVEDHTTFSISDTVIILASKLLNDVNIENDYVVNILRYFRPAIHAWEWPKQLLLSLNDNRYALLLGQYESRQAGIDYKIGISIDPTKLPAPLLQASVNLSGLSLLIE